MKILGIETSCDETAAAVVEDGTEILSNALSSSRELQVKYGGILPEQAAREQVKYIIPIIKEALLGVHSGSGNVLKEIDAIAVTQGPGLIGSLLIGIETAKTLAFVTGKLLIPINHHLGHIYASWLQTSCSNDTYLPRRQAGHHNEIPKLPAICLIVSGGHTLLIYMRDHGQWKILGQTRDDAAGEAFDKTARLLGFSYPGGPEIEKAAKKGNPDVFKFPRPMIDSDDFDFSFSGLKTAVLREVRHLEGVTKRLLPGELVSDLAAGIQEAIVDVLVDKTLQAAKEYKVKSIIIGGGVAANKRLKDKFMIHNLALSEVEGSKFFIHIPPPQLCTDNAAVIASAAFFNYDPISWDVVNVDPNLKFPSDK